MHYLLNAGESLYGVAVYFTNTCVSFSWAGFKPYQ
jgi:hypothetical protein